MEFQILGPLEVRGARGAVALVGIKPRAVLAVLLLHANEPVSAERLALALWGEDAPAGATKTVHVYVSRLRKALGDPAAIETTPAGYRLRVRPQELDAERFEDGVEAGRRALGDGRPEQGARLLREALELWRGPPLAELEFEPFAQAEIARLGEQRLAGLGGGGGAGGGPAAGGAGVRAVRTGGDRAAGGAAAGRPGGALGGGPRGGRARRAGERAAPAAGRAPDPRAPGRAADARAVPRRA